MLRDVELELWQVSADELGIGRIDAKGPRSLLLGFLQTGAGHPHHRVGFELQLAVKDSLRHLAGHLHQLAFRLLQTAFADVGEGSHQLLEASDHGLELFGRRRASDPLSLGESRLVRLLRGRSRRAYLIDAFEFRLLGELGPRSRRRIPVQINKRDRR